MERIFRDSDLLFTWVNNTNYDTEDLQAIVEHVLRDVKATVSPARPNPVGLYGNIKSITFRESKGTFNARADRHGLDQLYVLDPAQTLLVTGPGYRHPEILIAHPSKWNINPLQMLSDEDASDGLPSALVQQLAAQIYKTLNSNHGVYSINVRTGKPQEQHRHLTPVSGLRVKKVRGAGEKVKNDGAAQIRKMRQLRIAQRLGHKTEILLRRLTWRLACMKKRGLEFGVPEFEIEDLKIAIDTVSRIQTKAYDRYMIVEQGKEGAK